MRRHGSRAARARCRLPAASAVGTGWLLCDPPPVPPPARPPTAHQTPRARAQGIATVAAVDCSRPDSRRLCESYAVRGYPSLRLFAPDLKPNPYTGEAMKDVEEYKGARGVRRGGGSSGGRGGSSSGGGAVAPEPVFWSGAAADRARALGRCVCPLRLFGVHASGRMAGARRAICRGRAARRPPRGRPRRSPLTGQRRGVPAPRASRAAGSSSARDIAAAVTDLLHDRHIAAISSDADLDAFAPSLAADAAGKGADAAGKEGAAGKEDDKAAALARVLLFTDKPKTTVLYKALSTAFAGRLMFGQAHKGAGGAAAARLGVEEFPTLVVVKVRPRGRMMQRGWRARDVAVAELRGSREATRHLLRRARRRGRPPLRPAAPRPALCPPDPLPYSSLPDPVAPNRPARRQDGDLHGGPEGRPAPRLPRRLRRRRAGGRGRRWREGRRRRRAGGREDGAGGDTEEDI